MKIIFQHADILPVQKYGGTERILYWLMKELVKLGHHVSLIGHPKSQVSSIGVNLIPQVDADKNFLKDFRSLIPSDADLLHLQYAPPFPLDDIPYLVTIHGNGQYLEEFPQNTVFVSHNHARRHGSEEFVYNGLDFDEYPFHKRVKSEWNSFLFLAKASWKVKNLKSCVRVCKKEKKHLHIAGGRTFSLSRFIHSHGMVDQDEKLNLMRTTEALLFPVRWHEPFGVAVIEAFSQGLPVFASPYGALPELIDPTVGQIVSSEKELQQVIKQCPRRYQAEEIRNYVEGKFSMRQSALKYLSYYEKAAKGEVINPSQPMNKTQKDAQELLVF